MLTGGFNKNKGRSVNSCFMIDFIKDGRFRNFEL